MNKLKFLPLLFGVFGLFFLTSCGDDNDDPMDTVDPTMSIPEAQVLEDSVVTGSDDTLRFTVDALAGSFDLNAITFYENDERLPNFGARLFIDGESAVSNALTLVEDQRDELNLEVGIVAPDQAGSYEVLVEVQDTEGNITSSGFTYNVTDVTMLEGVLFNAGGPDGTGGLDLENGNSTNSDDPAAEIRDMGIDLDLDPTDNWLQQIAPANDSELATLSSEFDFSSVIFSEDIAGAFEAENVISESDKVEVGDQFAVRRGDSYYIFVVTDIEVTNGPDDNSDNYTLDIKRAR